ncbi:hypothetical protein P8629_03825 [Hydrogenovibrio sp. 3SP14C1]|uniref:hypothetical protein n=1 Tax=Hydrogenovibrio sp. 3SP14C1 TaxID=3038774 RepID=UPI002415B727|nr:hypothetical protein [Hydrogenovibrio sp. 3SP14C1]MDG4812125.1 hypothetical protein [Hydrogenovibrio sp. 3SP14C1]
MLYVKKISSQARLTVACISLMLLGTPDALADTKNNFGTQLFQTFNAVSGSLKSMFEMEAEVSFRSLNEYSYSVKDSGCCHKPKSITIIDFLRFGRDKSNLVLGLNLMDSNLLISKGDQWQMSLGVLEGKKEVYGPDNMGVIFSFQASLH